MMFQVSTLYILLGVFLVPLVIGLPVNNVASTQRTDPAYDMFRNFAGNFNPYVNPMNFIPQGGFPPPNPAAAYFPAGGQFPFGGGGGGVVGPVNPAQYPGSIYGQYPGQIPFGGTLGGGFVPGYGSPVTFGQYGNTNYPILNGMGYSGPFYGSQVGVANPSYGNTGSGTGAGTFASNNGSQQGGGVPIVNTRFNNGAGTGRPGSSSSSVVRTSDGGQVAVSVNSSPDGRPIFRSQTVQGPNSFGTAFAFASQSKP